MQYEVPYAPGGGWIKRRETLIPLVILVLIAIVILGKTTNMFCTVPGLGDVFCPKGQINIAIIGDLNAASGVQEATTVKAANLKTWLDSPEATRWGIQTVQFESDTINYGGTASLKGFSIVILAGERQFTRKAKDTLADYVEGGGKIIIIGDAATKDPDEPDTYIGWSGDFADVSPVRLRTRASLDSPIELASAIELRIALLDHAIVKGYFPIIDLSNITSIPGCNAAMKLVDVNAEGGANTIAYISGNKTDGNKTSRAAVVEKSGGLFSGNVMYFAYDPGCTPNMWISTVKYLSGK